MDNESGNSALKVGPFVDKSEQTWVFCTVLCTVIYYSWFSRRYCTLVILLYKYDFKYACVKYNYYIFAIIVLLSCLTLTCKTINITS